ncbi:MAG: hypothetical protein ACTHMM_04130 [Agriterribacter sp.]
MKYIVSFFFLIAFCFNGNAQSGSAFYLGPGFGFDHGGIGIKAEYQPVKYIGVFAGAGYNLASLGANGGIIYNILPDKRVTPVLTAMYGYNAVLKVDYQTRTDYSVYNGLTVGAGVDFKLGHSKRNKINVNLLVPLRSSAFFKEYNYIRENGTITQEMIPIGISFGWNFLIGGRK